MSKHERKTSVIEFPVWTQDDATFVYEFDPFNNSSEVYDTDDYFKRHSNKRQTTESHHDGDIKLDKISFKDVEVPNPGEGELLVQICAASLNPIDIELATQNVSKYIELPRILGVDAAGIIEKIGSGVSDNWKVGDRVYYHISYAGGNHGELAQYGVVDAGVVSRIADNISFEEAAALPQAGWTAYKALVDKARMRSGETILITAASSGVGGYAVQLAKLYGLKVIATCSEKNFDSVKELGADFCIDYSKENINDKVKEITNGKGVDIWMDNVSIESATRGIECIGFSGQLILVNGKELKTSLPEVLDKQISIHGVSLGSAFLHTLEAKKNLADIGDQMMKYLSEKKIKNVEMEIVTFEEIPKSMIRYKEKKTKGKIIVKLI